MEIFGSLVSQLGFPIALAIYSQYQLRTVQKAHLDDMRGIVSKALTVIESNTQALKEDSQALNEATELMRDLQRELRSRNGGN